MADDTDDPMRTAMHQVVGVFAQLERAAISKRLRHGRRRKADRDGYVGGAPSYGQRADARTRELVPNLDEEVTLDRITAMRADGMGYKAIPVAPDADGVSTKRNGQWHDASTVSRILDPAARARANADARLYRAQKASK